MSLLELKEISKSFGGVTAVKDVSLSVDTSEIAAVIGPNGAGKTTLFNLITGVTKPDSGTITYKERELNGRKPNQIADLGIIRTFQNLQLFSNMSAVENVMVGSHRLGRTGLFQAGLSLPGVASEEKRMYKKALQRLDFVGLADKAEIPADILPYGEQRLLEIARAMAAEPEIVLLDEPVAGLNSSETERLSELIRQLPDLGVTVFLVEHDMGMVMTISDKVTVLNYGEKLVEDTPRVVQNDKRVISAYLGEENEECSL